jgi:hypothetical protein
MIDEHDLQFLQFADQPQQAFQQLTAWLTINYPNDREGALPAR